MVLFDDEDPFNYNSYLSENTLAAVLISVFPFAAFDSAVVCRDIKGGLAVWGGLEGDGTHLHPPAINTVTSRVYSGGWVHVLVSLVYMGGWV